MNEAEALENESLKESVEVEVPEPSAVGPVGLTVSDLTSSRALTFESNFVEADTKNMFARVKVKSFIFIL